VLVIVLVLVIDSGMSAQSIGRLSSFTSASSDPLLTQQRSKLDDEHEND
jgi:hypothetical protein